MGSKIDREGGMYVRMLGSLHATHSIQSRRGLGYMSGIQGARHASTHHDYLIKPVNPSITETNLRMNEL